jgi:ubiquinone biosynthesis protein
LLRFLAIFLVSTCLLLLYGLLRIGTLFVFPSARRRSLVARIRGRLLRWAMTALGATFIKLGQVMSTRPDLLEQEMIDELRTLQDHLPAFSFRRARKIIEQELGKPIDELFVELDRKPVAAASVAQVHRGKLADGSEVAVKVLRPNIRRVVERDAIILRLFARLMALSKTMRQNDPVGHLAHFIEGIKEQTDLRQEARNYELFEKNFRDVEGVHFPKVYPELSRERVLTMEFMRGTKVDELPKGAHPEVGNLTRNAFLKMCFEDGFVHSDLHPGNMLITEESELVIFDVGLVKHLDKLLLDMFIDFSKCVSMGTAQDFTNHFKTFHTYMDNADWVQIEADSAAFVDKYRERNVAELEMGEFINETFALARKHNIRPVPELTLVLVGIVTAEGISKMLNPHVNTFAEMAQFLLPIIRRRGLRPATEPGIVGGQYEEDEEDASA